MDESDDGVERFTVRRARTTVEDGTLLAARPHQLKLGTRLGSLGMVRSECLLDLLVASEGA
jgi:hypothetical protein